VASLVLDLTSLWLSRLHGDLHWRVLFGFNRKGIADEPLDVLFKLLGQLDAGWKLLALGALAFNVWAFLWGRPRWMAWAALPFTTLTIAGMAVVM